MKDTRQVALAAVAAVVLAPLYRSQPVLLALVVPTFAFAILVSVALRFLIPPDVDTDDTAWLKRAVALTFGLHLATALAINSSSGLVSTFGGDATTYHDNAVALVQQWN